MYSILVMTYDEYLKYVFLSRHSARYNNIIFLILPCRMLTDNSHFNITDRSIVFEKFFLFSRMQISSEYTNHIDIRNYE